MTRGGLASSASPVEIDVVNVNPFRDYGASTLLYEAVRRDGNGSPGEYHDERLVR